MILIKWSSVPDWHISIQKTEEIELKKVSLQPIWFASKGDWKEYWNLWGLSGLYDKHILKSSKQLNKHIWVLKCFELRDNGRSYKALKSNSTPGHLKTTVISSNVLVLFSSILFLGKLLGSTRPNQLKLVLCSFDICTKMQRGWFESDFYGRLGCYRRAAPAIPFNEVKEGMIS